MHEFRLKFDSPLRFVCFLNVFPHIFDKKKGFIIVGGVPKLYLDGVIWVSHLELSSQLNLRNVFQTCSFQIIFQYLAIFL